MIHFASRSSTKAAVFRVHRASTTRIFVLAVNVEELDTQFKEGETS